MAMIIDCPVARVGRPWQDEEQNMRKAIAATVASSALLALTLPAAAFEWRARATNCEASRGELIARHLQCAVDPVVAPCGKIQAVHEDLGGVVRFEVLWLSGTRADVLVGPHEQELCILASRFISGRSMASVE
jgi:hypothetical protein